MSIVWKWKLDPEYFLVKDDAYTAHHGEWLLAVRRITGTESVMWLASIRCEGIAGAWEVEDYVSTIEEAKRAAVATWKKLVAKEMLT